MNFSDIFKQTNHLSGFSPNGQFVATVQLQRLCIRNVKTLKIMHTFICADEIELFEWSPDSCLILCGMLKRRIVQVWSLLQPEWICKIDEGTLGFISAKWSPDSRHILTTAKFHIKITIWSLVTKSVSYLKYSKASANPGLVFRKDGKYMALAERRDCVDHITIIDCENWLLVNHFQVGTKDLAGIAWSPSGFIITVWESLLEDYKIFCYYLNGDCIGQYAAQSNSLGIKRLTWSPTGQFLVIGGYNQKVKILNAITWRPISDYLHAEQITSKDIVVYQEVEKTPSYTSLMNDTCESHVPQNKYEVMTERPINILTNALENNKPYPKHGIGTLMFSSDSQYIASINDNMPATLWIWSMEKLALSVMLIQSQPIKCLAWDPFQPRLALCTGTNSVYLWTPIGCSSVDIPGQLKFGLKCIKWSPKEDVLLLIGKDNMCLCYLVD